MGEFTIYSYELYESRWKVKANSLSEVLDKWLKGDVEMDGDYLRHIQIMDSLGENGIRTISIPDGTDLFWDQIDEWIEKHEFEEEVAKVVAEDHSDVQQ